MISYLWTKNERTNIFSKLDKGFCSSDFRSSYSMICKGKNLQKKNEKKVSNLSDSFHSSIRMTGTGFLSRRGLIFSRIRRSREFLLGSQHTETEERLCWRSVLMLGVPVYVCVSNVNARRQRRHPTAWWVQYPLVMASALGSPSSTV